MRKGDKKKVLKAERLKHNRTIGVRFTKDEYEELCYMAGVTDKSFSEIIRYCVHNTFMQNKH